MSDRLIVLLAVLAAITLPIGFRILAQSREPDYLSYDDFIRAVEAGRIKSVALDRFYSITGTQTVGDIEKAFHCLAETGTANDPLLLRFLGEKSVVVTVSDRHQRERWYSGVWLPLMMFGVPVVTLVFVVLIYRRIRRVPPQQSS